MAKLYADDTFQAIDDNGNVISGARLFFYEVGTSTKQSTFTDDALSVANTNPVVCDSDGRPPDPIYFSDADYKVGLAAAGVDDPPAVFIRTTAVVHGASTIPTTGTLSKSVDYTVVAGDKGSMILVDASAAERTITLIGVTDEFQIAIKKTDSSTNAVVVDGAGSELIDGSLTLTLECQYDAVSLRSNATSWSVESRFNEFPVSTASKTASYEVLASDIGRTLLIDATTVTFAAGIQEDNSGGPSFIDETTDLNSAAANDVAFFPAGAGVDDAFYFGMTGKFAGLNMNVGTIGVGTYAVSWLYWDGIDWAALAGVSDGTDSFKTIDAKDVTFQVPVDWETTTVNSQGPFYYVKAIRDAGTVTTDPLGTQGKVFTTVLLPPAATARNGFEVSVQKTDSSVNAVTVATSVAETISGQATSFLAGIYQSAKFTTDGSEWFTISEAGDSRVLLKVQTPSTASVVDFVLPAGFDKYEVEVIDLLVSTDQAALRVRTSADGGTTFDSGASDYNSNIDGGAISLIDHLLFSLVAGTSALGNDAGRRFQGRLLIYNPSEANPTNMKTEYNYQAAADTFRTATVYGYRVASTATDAIRIFPSGGTITAKAVKLYGVR